MIEMQAILVELVENFEWSPAPGIEIFRAAAGLMSPMCVSFPVFNTFQISDCLNRVKGKETPKSELPLLVTPLN